MAERDPQFEAPVAEVAPPKPRASKRAGRLLLMLSVPVVLMGLLVSGACFALQEYLLPYANRRAAELRD